MVLSARAWKRRLACAVAATVVATAPACALVADPPDPTPRLSPETRTASFNIRPQSLRRAFLAFSEQAGVQLILTVGAQDFALRTGIRGEKSLTDALDLLIAGTPLEYLFTGDNTVIVRKRAGASEPVVASAREAEKAATAAAAKARHTENEIFLEELVTIGTRNRSRTVADTAVPIDVINTGALRRSGYVETGRLLQALAPSFNYTETTISDGTDIVRPATLRGLGPDQVLILVNGKRRHNQAWVNVQNTVGKGSVGTDMNTIPVSAIKRVEILRDGAAAQYGSDAIAGVINIVLNDASEGGSVVSSWGQTYEGDGDTFFVSGNVGLPIADGGFINITAEYRDRAATNRAGPSSITGDVIMRIGDTDVEAMALMWNVELGNDSSPGRLYAFGGYTDREGLSGGFFRHPFVANRTVPQVYPNGFLPLQTTDVTDFSQAIGFRYMADNGWDYDLSATYGNTRFAFGAENTVNVSLASAAYYNGGDPATASPSGGYSGALRFDQLTVNLDASGGDVGNGLLSHLAYGFEYRDEQYRIEAGDLASYTCGYVNGMAAPSILDPNEVAFCGFQGFPGYSTDVAGQLGRSSFALYLDAEFEPTDNARLTAAARFEHFDATGAKFTGKLTTRVQASETLAVRSAVSTGFRAPALAQRAFSSVITNTSADGLMQTLVAPEGHAIPAAFGVEKLRHETSLNFSLGTVWHPNEHWMVTLDAYRIAISDRIVLGPTLPLPDGIDLGVIEAGSFFSNAIDTETIGLDLVACYKANVAGGDLDLVTSFSWNKTEITDINAPVGVAAQVFFPLAEQVNVEKSQPRFRATASADYRRDRFGGVIRLNFYGKTESAFYTAIGNNIPPEIAFGEYGLDPSPTTSAGTGLIVDLELSYDVMDNVNLAVGANNLFNKMPDKLPNNALSRWISEGRQIGAFGNFVHPWVAMPWGLNGGSYYARMTISF